MLFLLLSIYSLYLSPPLYVPSFFLSQFLFILSVPPATHPHVHTLTYKYIVEGNPAPILRKENSSRSEVIGAESQESRKPALKGRRSLGLYYLMRKDAWLDLETDVRNAKSARFREDEKCDRAVVNFTLP